ncbi:phytoene desaturase family protein [Priestia aryabhattai]|uniref:4,4'-diaponeurosporene oxygenase n=1 Tax=Priestia aryabhattai TaxID=412384 RepID=A0AAX6N3X3_PRIAR|nr:phytoene desaturase family protein [Priestia aryabhattai]MDU9690380.1 phytoene desaturase family protein [Priestia aryabhattai]
MKKKVIVVGAGLGGLSAAIRLSADGYDVTVVEKSERIGGKLNIRSGKGFSFDTGPSILTMPWVLEQLFESAGRNIHDYLTIERIEPQWRTFFQDGTQIDLTSDLPRMLQQLQELAPEDIEGFFDYLSYANKMYESNLKSFYKKSLSGLHDLRTMHTVKELLQMDPMRSMDATTRKYFSNKHLRQLFNFLIMYIGSSPYHAPAVLTQLAHVQLGLGIYYVKGGMYKIAEAMDKLLQELGVTVHLNTPVKEITTSGAKATGITLENAESLSADVVVSNLEAIPTYRYLLKNHAQAAKQTQQLAKFEPTVSGLVLLLGVNKQYKQLQHHNFFFSKDQKEEFDTIFNKGKIAMDPTIYIGVSSKSDPTQAPEGKENLFVLTHVPPLKEGDDWAALKDRYRDVVLKKLEAMGLEDLRSSIEFEYTFTPNDIQELYGANGGSIYGVATDRKKNGGFKIPARSQLLSNLYFVGGSTHPGGGVPMVTLSGQLTADAINEDFQIPRMQKDIG